MYFPGSLRAGLVAGFLALAAPPIILASPAYDPLAVPAGFKPRTVDLVVHDAVRGRDIPILVYLPPEAAPAPIVLFSHGLGGSRFGSSYLGKHWSARGYVAVFVQHPGSDASVWQDKPPGQRMQALRQATSLQNFLLRVKDIPAVLDQLERWNRSPGNRFPEDVLAGRLDLTRVGMSGHSFGAVTTQALSGQTIAGGRAPFTDPRIKAAVIMSPSSPRRGTPQEAFGQVKIPWLLMTGTKDIAPIGDTDVKSRLAVFAALPPGHKYELVLNQAEHSAFTDRPLPGDSEARNPNHHRAILAISTALWDACLKHDPAAQAWLDGAGPRSVLEKEDRWQKK